MKMKTFLVFCLLSTQIQSKRNPFCYPHAPMRVPTVQETTCCDEPEGDIPEKVSYDSRWQHDKDLSSDQAKIAVFKNADGHLCTITFAEDSAFQKDKNRLSGKKSPST